jgi:glutaredoxin
MRPHISLVGLLLACALGTAAAQQLWQWTDKAGRVHITDTPPPPSARNVQKKNSPAPATATEATGQEPYLLTQATKEFPVVLYTSPICKEACAQAREALNKRGVPFKEVQVWDEKTNEELTKVSGAREVPTLLVGRSAQRGFEQGAFDALLDSARYPRTGLLPPRTQEAPALPEGYVSPAEREGQLKAEAVKPEPEEKPSGPYSPGAPRQRSQKK